MNKKTAVISDEQYNNIVKMIYNGGTVNNQRINKNKGMAIALIVTGNCGLRIGDCLNLRMCDFITQGGDHYFNITEQKTGKKRTTLIPEDVYKLLSDYSSSRRINQNDKIFPFGVRGIEKKLKRTADILGYEDVGTHSMRKRASYNLYVESGHDIELVRRFLNHSSPSTTIRYLNTGNDEMNSILKKNSFIPL